MSSKPLPLLALCLVFFADRSAAVPAEVHPLSGGKKMQGCILGNPHAKAWPQRKDVPGVVGHFFPDGRIIFDERPIQTWDFMATGTGVTGLTVTVDKNGALRIQPNHSASFDELGTLRLLGILRINWKDGPFIVGESVRMEHDLRRSLIELTTRGQTGTVKVQIRAHVELDVIRVDILDQRNEPRPWAMTLEGEEESPHEESLSEDNTYLRWHTNRSSVFRKANQWSGFSMGDDWPDFLLGRTFGSAIFIDGGDWSTGHLEVPAAKVHTLWIAGAATLNDPDAWRKTITGRIHKARSMGTDRFIESHEDWWRRFWDRSYFDPEDEDGKYSRHKASFDLYRYYIACCSSDRREGPVRLMNGLFRYNTVQLDGWLSSDIHGMELYQSVYGAMRTGDLAALRSRLNWYIDHLPVFRKSSNSRFGHAGSVCQYTTSVWGSALFAREHTDDYEKWKSGHTEASNYQANCWAGNLCITHLMCDYVAISGDEEFADNGLQRFADELLTFFLNHYPKRKDGKIVFEPSGVAEQWNYVRNSTEFICAMKMLLPRLIDLGTRRGWPGELVRKWQAMLIAIPPIPRGRLLSEPEWHIAPGDLLVPAEDMSKRDPRFRRGSQQPELYPIWPGKLVLRDPTDFDAAVRSYYARRSVHAAVEGWVLDVAFAACLGLDDDADQWFDYHFDAVNVLPCGLAQEHSRKQDTCKAIPVFASMQGLGTSVVPVYERLLQDYADEMIVLPCWPIDRSVRYALFSPFAGRVTLDYDADSAVCTVATQRPINVSLRKKWQAKVKLVKKKNP